MIKINLLPVKEEKKRVTLERQIITAVIVLLLTFAGIGYTAYLRKSQIRRLENQIEQSRRELNRLQKIKKKVEEFKRANANLQQKIGVITSLEKGRDWYLQLLDQLAESAPEGLWFESIKTPRGSSTGSIYNGAWQIRGGALEKDLVSDFISNIEQRKKYFSSANLSKIEMTRKGKVAIPYYRFELSVNVKKPPTEAGAS